MSKPLFVVSAPRSGSTLAVTLLDSHPSIVMTTEAAWITFLRKAELLAATRSLEPIDDGEGFSTVGILPDRYLPDLRATFDAAVPEFVASFYARLAPAAPTRYHGDKILSRNDLEFATRHFADAKFVELLRDPRDVIASTYAFEAKQPMAWGGASFDARCEHLAAFFAATDDLLDGRDRHVLRYEDLMRDRDATVAAVFAFLDLDVHDDVRAHLDADAKALFSSHGTSRDPLASIGRWRTDLDDVQQQRVADRLGEQLARLGYGS